MLSYRGDLLPCRYRPYPLAVVGEKECPLLNNNNTQLDVFFKFFLLNFKFNTTTTYVGQICKDKQKKKNKNRNYNNNELFICLVEIANEKAKHRCTCAEYVMTEYLIQFRSNIYGVSRTLLLLSLLFM